MQSNVTQANPILHPELLADLYHPEVDRGDLEQAHAHVAELRAWRQAGDSQPYPDRGALTLHAISLDEADMELRSA